MDLKTDLGRSSLVVLGMTACLFQSRCPEPSKPDSVQNPAELSRRQPVRAHSQFRLWRVCQQIWDIRRLASKVFANGWYNYVDSRPTPCSLRLRPKHALSLLQEFRTVFSIVFCVSAPCKTTTGVPGRMVDIIHAGMLTVILLCVFVFVQHCTKRRARCGNGDSVRGWPEASRTMQSLHLAVEETNSV